MQAVTIAEFGLNEREAEFVRELVAGTKIVTAAERVGYNEIAAYRIAARPSVAAAVEAALRQQLLTEGAPLAYRVAKDMLQNEKIGGPTRAMLVKIILDRAGITPPAPDKDPAHGRPINELTSSELVGFIAQRQAEAARLEAELDARANRARRVDNAPIPDAIASDVAGLLE